MKYRITGVFFDSWYCDCEFCEGHDEILRISEVVDADDAGHAEKTALIKHHCVWDGDEDRQDRWKEGPFIEEMPQDQLMRMMGCPELPGLVLE